MKSNTFSVVEFNSLCSMIENQSSSLSNKASSVANLCNALSNVINSTDTGLSGAYTRLADAIVAAKNNVVGLMQQLEEEIKLYQTSTIANEEETTSSLQEIDANLDAVNAVFNNIMSKNG